MNQGSSPSKVRNPKADPRFLSSVARALCVLEELSSTPRGQGLTELSRTTGIALPTLQRLTKTLEACGFVTRSLKTKRYAPAIKTVDLLHRYLIANELAKTAWPHLVRLRESTGMGVSLSVPANGAMLYVHRLPSYRGDFENTLSGKKIPLHLSASGRCVLASWPEHHISHYLDSQKLAAQTIYSLTTRDALRAEIAAASSQGYCIVEQEMSMGVNTIAAPVLAGTSVRAGVSVHAPTSLWSPGGLETELSSRLLDVARALSETASDG